MKLQFSLATLLVCMAIAGIVVRICFSIPVNQAVNSSYTVAVFEGNPKQYRVHIRNIHRLPNLVDASLRMAWAEPLAIAATLTAALAHPPPEISPQKWAAGWVE